MAGGQRQRSGPPAGPDAPASPARSAPPRRPVLAPANDNTLSPAQRIVRAAVFVALGAVLAWLLRMALG